MPCLKKPVKCAFSLIGRPAAAGLIDRLGLGLMVHQHMGSLHEGGESKQARPAILAPFLYKPPSTHAF